MAKRVKSGKDSPNDQEGTEKPRGHREPREALTSADTVGAQNQDSVPCVPTKTHKLTPLLISIDTLHPVTRN